MPIISTEQYLRQIDHALDGMAEDSIDKLRVAEINNIRQSIQMAIMVFVEKEPDAELFAKEMIALLRDRIDTIAANPEYAGEHEQFRDTWPAPACE